MRTLRDLLKSGTLPVKLQVLSSERVDPSIGRNALDKIVTAGVAAAVVIAAFMLVYYVFPGFIAEAGLWGDTGLTLPRGSGRLRTPDDVAEAVLRAIDTNRPEIDVAPVLQRSGGWFTGFAPRFVAASIRAGGGERLSAAMAEAQRQKR